jgi:hypothetical protein
LTCTQLKPMIGPLIAKLSLSDVHGPPLSKAYRREGESTVVKRVRLKRKARSQSKVVSSASAPPWRLFGQPNILEGEDAAAYEELLARIRAAIKPDDTIEEMFIHEVVALEWEVLRWRRLKSSLIQSRGCKALEGFLVEQFKSNYALHEEHFKGYLEEIFRNNLPEDQADSAETLAAECAPNDAEADDKLDKVLRSIGLDRGTVLDEARALRARELVQEYVRREPDTVVMINELLTEAGASIDGFMADALVEKLEYIERIDRLAAIAESRRNASLCEIERRRAVFGATLRRNVQEIEDAEFKEIETTPAKGKPTLDERP